VIRTAETSYETDSLADALRFIADALNNAPRDGAETDEPEGARYITISETYLGHLVSTLRGLAKTYED
jgi:hypothetical protein